MANMQNVSDNNGGDGGDFELISQHREQNPKICQKPKAIDYKTQRKRFIFQFAFDCFKGDFWNLCSDGLVVRPSNTLAYGP